MEFKKTNRIYYFDVLRVIACLCVIMIHASADYVKKDFDSLNFWSANIFDSISRIGVPIFVMISGALLLDENYNYSFKKILRHIFRMVIFFIFWSFIYTIFTNVINYSISNKEITFEAIKTLFLNGNYHLWFCFMIVGLYLLVPVLRLWVKKVNKKYVEYFLLLAFIFIYLLPQIVAQGGYYTTEVKYLNNALKNLNIQHLGGYISYFILGWYLHNFEFKHKPIIYILGVIGLCYTIFMTYVLSNSQAKAIQAYGEISVNVMFQSIAIFVLVKSSLYKEKEYDCWVCKGVNLISKLSLGIYAVHVLFVKQLYYVFNHQGFIFALGVIPAIFIISFALSFAISYLISLIPYARTVVS